MTSYKYHNHIIVCEWNSRSQRVLSELRLDPETTQTPIVLIAELDQKPVDDDELFFVNGAVNDDTLTRANLIDAQTVIILGDDRLEPNARDAKVVLATLTVESMNSNVYTIVELVSDANARHCQRAHANEIIVGNDLSSGLVARAALDHGVTRMVSQLLSTSYGDEIYKIPVPTDMVGRAFLDALTRMKEQHNCIVIAVEHSGGGDLSSNPPADFKLERGDYLIVIAAERPQIRA